METIIKNVHLLEPNLEETQLARLTAGAFQHKRFSRITFKVLEITDKVLKIQTSQSKSPQENYADEKTLVARSKELFSTVYPDLKIIVNAVPYKENPTEQVTPEYIRHVMTEHKIKVKDIVADTGIDKTNVSAWINGTRDMSQPVKALFYYYLKQKSLNFESTDQ